MSDGLWVVIGVIIGVIGPLVARFVWDWYMRPILIIGKDVPQEAENYIHHSIRIENRGRTAAKNCTSLLTVVGMEKGDVVNRIDRHAYVTTNTYRPIKDESICWALQIPLQTGKAINPAFLTIFPGSTRLVELCGVWRQSLEMELPSEMGWESRRAVLRGNKEYEMELKLFAENVHYDPHKHNRKFKLVPDLQKKDIIIKRIDC